MIGGAALAVGTGSRIVATAERDQGLVGTPGPGGPVRLAHNDPRSACPRLGTVRMRIWDDLSTCRLPTDYTDVQ